jgi:hypothetical protein
MDPYLLGMARMKEAELRRRTPEDVGRPVGRTRIVLARWLIAAAERLWPEAGRKVIGEAR